MGAIFRREMGAFFSSAIAYIFLGVLFEIAGFFFINGTLAYGTSDLSGTFGSVFLFLIFLIPLMTMKLFSEEKRQRTEQGLLTAPISITEMVLPMPYLFLRNSIFSSNVLGTSVVWKGPPSVRIRTRSQVLREPVTAKITLTLMMGLMIGITTYLSICQGDAPSSIAASRSSVDTPLTPAYIRSI